MPITKFDATKGTSSNKGSCRSLVNYLEKENIHRKIYDMEFFFNHLNNLIPDYEVVNSIDGLKQGLSKDDAKFYSGSINLSQEELSFLNNDIKAIKAYTIEVIKLYAANFNREGLTINDLNWFAKLEMNRYRKAEDPKVISGEAKIGDKIIDSTQIHTHFIIGRKTLDNKQKLSPKTNHRSTNSGPVRGGFDRELFTIACEKKFDQMFNYNRPTVQTYDSQNKMKNGELGKRYNLIAGEEKKRIKEIEYSQLSNDDKEKKLIKLIQFIRFGHKEQKRILDKDLILKTAANNQWNGNTYHALINLNQKLKKDPELRGDLTLYIIKYIEFLNKPYKELPQSFKHARLKYLINQLNKRLPEDAQLDHNKLLQKETIKGFNGGVNKGLLVLQEYISESKDIGNDPTRFVLNQSESSTGTRSENSGSTASNFSQLIKLNINSNYISSDEFENDEEELKRKKKRRRLRM
ncbi:DUF5712 family protein [Ancylomarina sp. YFZ004]